MTLVATPPGELVYRRLGYAESGRGRWWMLAPEMDRWTRLPTVRSGRFMGVCRTRMFEEEDVRGSRVVVA